MQTKRATVRGLDPAEKAVISIMNALAMHWSVGGLQVLSLLGVTGTKLQILIPEGGSSRWRASAAHASAGFTFFASRKVQILTPAGGAPVAGEPSPLIAATSMCSAAYIIDRH
jgi:hypothetical protein